MNPGATWLRADSFPLAQARHRHRARSPSRPRSHLVVGRPNAVGTAGRICPVSKAPYSSPGRPESVVLVGQATSVGSWKHDQVAFINENYSGADPCIRQQHGWRHRRASGTAVTEIDLGLGSANGGSWLPVSTRNILPIRKSTFTCFLLPMSGLPGEGGSAASDSECATAR
jgi:hypothetical protein